MRQEAPDPQALRDLVGQLDYKGWQVYLADIDRGQGSKGLTLVITREGPDTYHPENIIRVAHYMPVPPASFSTASWQRWLFEQFLLVERHEAAEFFRIGDDRPFRPNHGNGEDPYVIHDPTTDEARRTSFRGILDDDGTGWPKGPVTDAVIGPKLAAELGDYRGQWVAVIRQHVVAAGADASGVAAGAENLGHQAGAYLLFRVPQALAAFLGIGQS